MADRHVVDVHEIHAGFHIRPHPPLHEIDDYLTRRGRLDVRFPNGRGGVDNDHREPGAGELEYFLFGQVLGPLVMALHRGEGCGSIFRCRLPIGQEPDGPDGAGINDSFDAGLAGFLQEQAGACDVGLVKDRGVLGPEGVMGGHMIEMGTTRERLAQGTPVTQVAVRRLDGQALQIPAITIATEQHAYLYAGCGQCASDRPTDKPSRACDERFHPRYFLIASLTH